MQFDNKMAVRLLSLVVLGLISNATSQILGNGIGYNGLIGNGLVDNGMANGFGPNCYGANFAPNLGGAVPIGYGDVAVTGQLPVGGNTAVAGQVPVIGYVNFEGYLPAGGLVSVAPNCGCI